MTSEELKGKIDAAICEWTMLFNHSITEQELNAFVDELAAALMDLVDD